MQNFTFHNPTKILFGEGQIAQIGAEIPAQARVLITYGGGSIKKNGTLGDVRTALAGRKVFEFGGIEPNPTYETLMQAVALARTEAIDFLLAVGGGSVIDGTKFISAAIPFAGDPWDILSKRARIETAVPFGSVLTLPATGSEMNSGAVITRKASVDKLAFMNPLLYPQFSVLDPVKTYSLPPRQVANGIVDAFVHVIEQYLTYPAGGAVQDRFAEGLLLTLIEEGPKALASPENYEVRANIMWCATLALNGLISTGVPQDWTTHMIGHELTVLHGFGSCPDPGDRSAGDLDRAAGRQAGQAFAIRPPGVGHHRERRRCGDQRRHRPDPAAFSRASAFRPGWRPMGSAPRRSPTWSASCAGMAWLPWASIKP